MKTGVHMKAYTGYKTKTNDCEP